MPKYTIPDQGSSSTTLSECVPSSHLAQDLSYYTEKGTKEK